LIVLHQTFYYQEGIENVSIEVFIENMNMFLTDASRGLLVSFLVKVNYLINLIQYKMLINSTFPEVMSIISENLKEILNYIKIIK